MVDVDRYSDWNPFVVSVECHDDDDNNDGSTMKVGTTMTLTAVMDQQKTTTKQKKEPKTVQSKEKALVLDPPEPDSNDTGSDSGSTGRDTGPSTTPKSATWTYQFVSWLHYFNLVRTGTDPTIDRNHHKCTIIIIIIQKRG
mmetsp:Transcript_20201/g.48188  ORF Transcript_20201/g.48188 Transcript_20201/m.48188 type:complete len:141 (-) Transcript_20201:205-627(-)